MTSSEATPSTTRLVWSDVDAIRTGASTAPATMAATDSAVEDPHDAPQDVGGDDTGQRGLGDHLAGHQTGASDHGHRERHDETVDAGVRELRGAHDRAGGDDDDARPDCSPRVVR